MLLLLETTPHLSAWSVLPPGGHALLLTTIVTRALLVVVVVRAALGHADRANGAAAIALTVAGFASASLIEWPSGVRAGEAALMVPLWSIQALELALLAVAPSRRAGLALVGMTLPAHLLLQDPGSLTRLDLDAWVGGSGGALAIGALIGWLRRAASYGDDLEETRVRLRRAMADSPASDARRILHDEVLVALAAVGSGMGAAPARAMSASAVAAVTDRRPVRTVQELVSVLRQSGVTREVRGTWSLAPGVDALTAFTEAAREALRNVAQHTDADAVIRLEQDGTQVALVITDSGPGLRDSPPGFGISESIIGRMEAVGGSAAVTSSENGVTVRLVHRVASPAAPDLTAVANRLGRRGYVVAVAPMVACNLYLACVQPTSSRPASLAIAAAMAVSVAVSARVPARRAGQWSLMVFLTGVACLLGALGMALGPDGALMGVATWPVALAPMLVAVPSIEAPLSRAIVPLVGLTALVAGAAIADPTVAVLQPTSSYMSAWLPLIFCAALGALLRSGTRRLGVREALLAAERAEAAHQRANADARAEARARLDSAILPLLHAVAEGAIITEDVMAEARLHGARLREHLSAAPAPSLTLRTVVDRARAGGHTVGLRGDDTRDEVQDDRLGALLAAVLQVAGFDVATVFRGAEGRVVVLPALTPAATQEVGRLHPQARVETDAFRTVLWP